MWPVLFRIPIPEWFPEFLQPKDGSFPIRMFGVMVILGFLAGAWVIRRRLEKSGIVRPRGSGDLTPAPGTLSREEVFDFCFYLLLVGILGSRLMYVVQNLGEFQGKIGRVFAIWEGGLVWYGGFALSTLFAFWWLWKKKLPVLKVADAAALGVALALAVGRWGCFCAGDDYGKQILAPPAAVAHQDGEEEDAPDLHDHPVPVRDAAQAPWYAIKVPTQEDLDWRWQYSEFPRGWAGTYVHPVQIYMSIKNLVIFGALLLVASRARRRGMIAASYLLLYPVGRFVIEFWRGDEDRITDVMGTGLSFSQFFGIFVFVAGIGVLRAVKARPPEASTTAA